MAGRKATHGGGSLWLPLLLLFPLALRAEGGKALTVIPAMELAYSSNLFLDSSQYAATFLAPAVDLEWQKGDLSLFLSADQRIFRESSDLNTSGATLGATFARALTPRTTIIVSPDFSLEQFRGEFTYLDSNTFALALGVKHYFRPQVFSRLTAEVSAARFSSEPAFDHSRLTLQAETSLFFQSQTTVRLQAGFNWLRFPSVPLDSQSLAPEPVEPMNGRAGRRRSGTVTQIFSFAYGLPYASLRLAQGIGPAVGLFAEFQRRWLADDLAPLAALANDEWAMPGTGDTFTWDGERWSAGLKAPLAGFDLAVDAAFLRKAYPGFSTADGGVDRRDRQFLVRVLVERSIGRLDVSMRTELRRNESSDERFRYRMVAVRLGLGYTF